MSGAVHLVARFLGSLSPLPPRSGDVTWAISQLLDDEADVWSRMSSADRRHAIGVARRVAVALPSADRPVLAAALLHDVGKLDAKLGTFGRVVATLCGLIAGRDMAPAWASKSGFTRRVGLYLQHDEIGAVRLELLGSDPLTVAWAREHHLPSTEWTVRSDIATVLKESDDD
jgi:hypothetical protein